MQDFDKIYAEYFTRVFKFTQALCKNPSVAEEITQETFFKALKSIDKFDSRCNITTWLCKIAKNTYFDYAKKHSIYVDYPMELIESDENIGERLENRETVMTVHKVLHGLKEPYKEVFWLRTFGGLSFSQIGILFEKTDGWARVTYYRAKLLIKEEME